MPSEVVRIHPVAGYDWQLSIDLQVNSSQEFVCDIALNCSNTEEVAYCWQVWLQFVQCYCGHSDLVHVEREAAGIRSFRPFQSVFCSTCTTDFLATEMRLDHVDRDLHRDPDEEMLEHKFHCFFYRFLC